MTTTHHTSARTHRADHRDALRTATAVVAGTFLVVGVAGFVPGLTQHLGDIEFAGHESGAELLGIFQVSVLHNLVHLAFGIVGLLCLRRAESARAFLLVGGAVYVVLFLYGLVIEEHGDANFVPVDDADDWLHLALGLGMLGLGFLLPRGDHESRPTPSVTDR